MASPKSTEESPKALLTRVTSLLTEASFVDGDEDERDRILDALSDFITLDSERQQECAKMLLSDAEFFQSQIDRSLLAQLSLHWFDEWYKTGMEEMQHAVLAFFPTLAYLLLTHLDSDAVSGIHTLFLNIYAREAERSSTLPFGLPSLATPGVYHINLPGLQETIHDEVYQHYESKTFVPPVFPKIRSVTNETLDLLLNCLLSCFAAIMASSPLMVERFLSLCDTIAFSAAPVLVDAPPLDIEFYYPLLPGARILSPMVLERLCYGLSLIIHQPQTPPQAMRRAFRSLELLLNQSLLQSDTYLSLKINVYYLQSRETLDALPPLPANSPRTRSNVAVSSTPTPLPTPLPTAGSPILTALPALPRADSQPIPSSPSLPPP